MTALLPEFPAISAKNFNLVDWLSYFTPASTRSLSHYIEIHRDTLCDSNSSQPPISDKKNSIKSRDSRVNYLSMRATWLTSNEHLYRQCRYIFLRRLSFFTLWKRIIKFQFRLKTVEIRNARLLSSFLPNDIYNIRICGCEEKRKRERSKNLVGIISKSEIKRRPWPSPTAKRSTWPHFLPVNISLDQFWRFFLQFHLVPSETFHDLIERDLHAHRP